MENTFKKYLEERANRKKRKLLFSKIKKILFFVGALFIIIILFNLAKKITSFKKNSADKNNSETTHISIGSKHDDEYYYDMIDDYIIKVNSSNIDNVINSYNNLGIIQCNGYINFRSEPNENNTRSIIGLMNNGDALDIIEWDLKNNNTYCKVKSGGMTGYVAKQFVTTGEQAILAAKKNVAVRAIVLVDKLRMRSSPDTNSDNIVGTTYKGERYKLISVENNWAKVYSDNIENVQSAYISADDKYIDIMYCLSEARTQDLKSDVLNYYDNICVSTARDYINIRKTAKSNGTIIGKLPGKAGCEILGESGSFYKIKSGKVTGYVSKQYLATGKRAEDLALQYADLRAIIKIAALKVRSGPGTKYKQWTTIRREETYIVTNQLDGWVEIEIDEDSDKGYISTSNNYVEV